MNDCCKELGDGNIPPEFGPIPTAKLPKNCLLMEQQEKLIHFNDLHQLSTGLCERSNSIFPELIRMETIARLSAKYRANGSTDSSNTRKRPNVWATL